MTFNGVLAEIILVVHIAYMAYAVFGQFAILIGWPLGWSWIRNPWFRLTHLTMIVIVALEALADVQCPLTVWERELRGETGEEGSFTGRLIHDSLTFDEKYLNPIFIGAGIVVVATIFLVPPRLRRREAAASPPS